MEPALGQRQGSRWLSATIHREQAFDGVQRTWQPRSDGAGPHDRRDLFVRTYVVE
jgi:hypothetical protein